MSLRVEGREHSSLKQDENLGKIKEYFLKNSSNRKKQETLGLHWHGKDIRPGDYIGAVWIDTDGGRVELHVGSKFEK